MSPFFSPRRYALIAASAFGLAACSGPTETPTPTPEGPLVTFDGVIPTTCPVVKPNTVLVDPTHDGGVWWFPQSEATGFNADAAHQGKALADTLRARGYTVKELARGQKMAPDSMMKYAIIIRAGYYSDAIRPGYEPADINAYAAFANCPRTLVVLAEYLRTGQHDALADAMGFPLEGQITGSIDTFEAHPLTAGVTTMSYIAGSWLSNPTAPGIQVLGYSQGKAVMGLLTNKTAKVFFIGDVNGIQRVPQPFVANLIAWGF